MAVKIPLTNELVSYIFEIALDNQTFKFDVYYNSRLNRWILSIFNLNNEPILCGIPLLVASPLIQRFRLKELEGEFILVNNKNPFEEVDRQGLQGAELIYYNKDELTI
jgi:hypothetical protein